MKNMRLDIYLAATIVLSVSGCATVSGDRSGLEFILKDNIRYDQILWWNKDKNKTIEIIYLFTNIGTNACYIRPHIGTMQFVSPLFGIDRSGGIVGHAFPAKQEFWLFPGQQVFIRSYVEMEHISNKNIVAIQTKPEYEISEGPDRVMRKIVPQNTISILWPANYNSDVFFDWDGKNREGEQYYQWILLHERQGREFNK